MNRYDAFIERNLDVVIKNDAEFYCRCPFHTDNSPSFAINGKSGLWICHGCHVKGNIDTLATQLGTANVQTLDGLRDYLDVVTENLSTELETETLRVLPEAWLAQFDTPHPYWDERGLDKIVQSAFDVGFDLYRESVTIPLRNADRNLLGVVRRKIENDATPKYMYPKGFKAAENLFASWLIEGETSVALVEGTIDAMACWASGVPALGVYGSRLSDYQKNLIRQLGITTVVFMFDNDEAGTKGIQEAISSGMEGISWKVALDYPIGAKDPGDLSNRQIRDLYNSAKRLWHLQ